MRGLLFICLLVLALAPLASQAQDSRAVIRDFVEFSGKQLLTCKATISQSCNSRECSHTALNPGVQSLTIDLVKPEVTSCWFDECYTNRFIEAFDHAGLVIGFREPEMFFNNITLFDVWVKLRPFEDHVVTMSFGTHAKSTHTTHYDCEVEP